MLDGGGVHKYSVILLFFIICCRQTPDLTKDKKNLWPKTISETEVSCINALNHDSLSSSLKSIEEIIKILTVHKDEEDVEDLLNTIVIIYESITNNITSELKKSVNTEKRINILLDEFYKDNSYIDESGNIKEFKNYTEYNELYISAYDARDEYYSAYNVYAEAWENLVNFDSQEYTELENIIEVLILDFQENYILDEVYDSERCSYLSEQYSIEYAGLKKSFDEAEKTLKEKYSIADDKKNQFYNFELEKQDGAIVVNVPDNSLVDDNESFYDSPDNNSHQEIIDDTNGDSQIPADAIPVQLWVQEYKYHYSVGESFDPAGLWIMVYYESQTSSSGYYTVAYEDEPEKFIFTGTDFSKGFGLKTINLTYKGVSADFYIEVDIPVASIDIKYTFDEVTGILSVYSDSYPASIPSYSFNEETPWKQYENQIKKVVIAEGIIEIGYNAFSSLPELNEVILPNSLQRIKMYAFSWCEKLEKINLPEGLIEIEEDAFWDNQIKEFKIPSTLIKLCGFKDFSELEELYVPDTVQEMSVIFRSCPKLKDIRLPENIDVGYSGLVDFSDCPLLESIVLPENVKKMEYSYGVRNCASLKSISIGKNVAEIESCSIRNCPKLEYVYYNAVNAKDSDMYGGSVGGFISDCGNESDGIELIIGKNVRKIPPHFATNFGNNFIYPKLKKLTFEDGSCLEEIGFYAFGVRNFDSADNAFPGFVNSELKLPNTVREIGHFAFAGAHFKGTLTIPPLVTELHGGVFVRNNFSGDLVIPDTVVGFTKDAYELEEEANSGSGIIEDSVSKSTFYRAGSFTSLYISKNIQIIPASCFESSVFSCNLKLPDSVKEILREAFSYCGFEKSELIFPESLKSIEDLAFLSCNFTKVILPREMEKLGSAYLEDDYLEYLSEGYSRFESRKYNMSGVFEYCHSLKEVYLPDSLAAIGVRCFAGCDGGLVIKNWPQNLKVIESRVFDECDNVQFPAFPDSLEKLIVPTQYSDNIDTKSHMVFSATSHLAYLCDDGQFPAGATSIQPARPFLDFMPPSLRVTRFQGSYFRNNTTLSLSYPEGIETIGRGDDSRRMNPYFYYEFKEETEILVFPSSIKKFVFEFDTDYYMFPSAKKIKCLSATVPDIYLYTYDIESMEIFNDNDMEYKTVDVYGTGTEDVRLYKNQNDFINIKYNYPYGPSLATEHYTPFMPYEILSEAILYVPDESIEVYKNAECIVWRSFKEIKGISEWED